MTLIVNPLYLNDEIIIPMFTENGFNLMEYNPLCRDLLEIHKYCDCWGKCSKGYYTLQIELYSHFAERKETIIEINFNEPIYERWSLQFAFEENYLELQDRLHELWKIVQPKLKIIYLPINGYGKKIMVVGYMGRHLAGATLSDALEAANYRVIRVAKDMTDSKTGQYSPNHPIDKADIRIADMALWDNRTWKEPVDLSGLVQFYLPDYVLLMESDFPITFTLGDLPVKTFFWQSEILWERWPIGFEGKKAEKLQMLYAYYGMPQNYVNHHTYEMAHAPKPQFWTYWAHDYIPYEWTTPTIKRKYFLGFMGRTESHPTPNAMKVDYRGHHMRDLRNRFINYLDENYGHISSKYSIGFENRPVGTIPEYHAFIQECELFLNVPAPYGGVNERQFDVPYMGTVLLQYAYPELEELGFIDKVNCLTFKDEEELDRCIQYYRSLSEEQIEALRQAGKALVTERHTLATRVRDLHLLLKR